MYDICINDVSFEWDEEKEKINLKKHGITFNVAKNVFLDENRIERFDDLHSSSEEDRYITIGTVGNIAIVIALVYTQRLNNVSIISARKATRKEEEVYYNGDCEI